MITNCHKQTAFSFLLEDVNNASGRQEFVPRHTIHGVKPNVRNGYHLVSEHSKCLKPFPHADDFEETCQEWDFSSGSSKVQVNHEEAQSGQQPIWHQRRQHLIMFYPPQGNPGGSGYSLTIHLICHLVFCQCAQPVEAATGS